MSTLAAIHNVCGEPVEPAHLGVIAGGAPDRKYDRAASWIGGQTGLAVRLLHCTPESVYEEQPWASEHGAIRIVLDGRIDNRGELIQFLKAAEVRLGAATDVELVGGAYQLWGEDAWDRLVGDFAVVVWDARSRKMLCARDPLGFKPLHYYFDGKTFLCASELIQILQHPRIPRILNEAFLGEYLADGPYSREETVITGIFRLEAGACLAVDESGLRKRRYFDLAALRPLHFATYDDCIDALREIMVEAVRCRLRSAGAVASHLSGGLDSSTVVGIASALVRSGECRAPVKPFSLVFSDRAADERNYIADVERAWDVSSCCMGPFEPDAAYFKEYAAGTFELPRHPNSVMFEDLERRFTDEGMRVCLTGHGGDHCFDGDPWDLSAVLRGLRLSDFFSAVGSLKQAKASGEVTGSTAEIVLRCGLWPLLPNPLRWLVRRLTTKPPRHSEGWKSWIRPEFTGRIELLDRVKSAQAQLGREGGILSGIALLLRDPWTTYGVEGEERCSSRLGFEYHHPFADRRLIEFMLALDPAQRWNRGVSRFMMRQAARSFLPETIRSRRDKGDFSVISMKVLAKISAQTRVANLADAGWIDPIRFRNSLDSMWRLFRQGSCEYGLYLWSAFTAYGLEIWSQTQMEHSGAPNGEPLPRLGTPDLPGLAKNCADFGLGAV